MTSLIQPLKWRGIKYKPIPGCSGYLAGEDGSVASCFKFVGKGHGKGCNQINTGFPRRLLKPDIRKIDGRKRYTVRDDDGTYCRKYGSHFVLEAFVGPKPEGMEACHGDGNCANDTLTNLRWDTPINNKSDMIKHGTRLRGERHPKSKVTDEQAAEIKSRRTNGESLKSLANEFRISQSAVSFIAKGKRRNAI